MIQSPRGTRDFLPDDMERRRFYESILRQTARRSGFREIQTPIFEEAELFVLRSGPNILKELYAFRDKGGRDLALRPEMTAPAIRAFVNGMSNEPKPIKIFYFGQCFRYERPQSGRYREFFQFGAEIIGAATPETDAEMIAMAIMMIEALGLKDYKVRIGHIGILRRKLADAGVTAEKMPEILQKLDKKLYSEAWPLMEDSGVSREDADSIFETSDTAGGVEVLDGIAGDEAQYMIKVLSYLSAIGVAEPEIDLGVVRGLDYYTGIVFEAEAPALGAEKQVCGGGSYALSELFGGEKVFSTGFAIGFDRVLLALENEGAVSPAEKTDAYVVAASGDVKLKAFEIVGMLRRNGLSADIDLADRKMAKAMKHASSVGSRFAVIVGSEELKSGSVMLRDMSSGEQKAIKIADLPAEIRGH
ncbi:MAG: histidine--tRNA ligase [Candidatus Methanoplasma sp.]|jgi:histidyl-tRNA synthetase|nr:histidine--tRNA ligase [Candidatus Methanoplasma sp.]